MTITVAENPKLCLFFSTLVNTCFVLPHNNIIFIYTGAQRLIVQDTPVSHYDASFTAETGRKEAEVSNSEKSSHMIVMRVWVSTCRGPPRVQNFLFHLKCCRLFSLQNEDRKSQWHGDTENFPTLQMEHFRNPNKNIRAKNTLGMFLSRSVCI